MRPAGTSEVILLGYGLCSMAWLGCAPLRPRWLSLAPMTALPSSSARAPPTNGRLSQEPGTYYLTKGWIEVGDSPFSEHEKLVVKYGEAKALRMMRLTLKNYTRLAFINTGDYNLESYRDYARRNSEKFELRDEEIDGSPALIKGHRPPVGQRVRRRGAGRDDHVRYVRPLV